MIRYFDYILIKLFMALPITTCRVPRVTKVSSDLGEYGLNFIAQLRTIGKHAFARRILWNEPFLSILPCQLPSTSRISRVEVIPGWHHGRESNPYEKSGDGRERGKSVGINLTWTPIARCLCSSNLQAAFVVLLERQRKTISIHVDLCVHKEYRRDYLQKLF